LNKGIVEAGILFITAGLVVLSVNRFLGSPAVPLMADTESTRGVETAVTIGLMCGGVVAILYGVFAKPSKRAQWYQPKLCGNCVYFGEQECLREEKDASAMPCEKFTRKDSA
jgi:hypothetical protein